jgi:hypothetical protein
MAIRIALAMQTYFKALKIFSIKKNTLDILHKKNIISCTKQTRENCEK